MNNKLVATILLSIALPLTIYLLRSTLVDSRIENSRWHGIEESHPVIVLASTHNTGNSVRHDFHSFIKNDMDVGVEKVQESISKFDGDLQSGESVGKWAIFLMEDSNSLASADPNVVRVLYVHDGCITLPNEHDVRVELAHIRGE